MRSATAWMSIVALMLLFTACGTQAGRSSAASASSASSALSANRPPTATDSRSQQASSVQVLVIPKLDHITVDGADGDWGQAGLRVDAFCEDWAVPLPADMVSAHLRLAWTEEGLAVLAELSSSCPWIESDAPRSGYERDSIELFLRQGSQWNHLVQAVITPGMTPDHGEPRSFIWDYRGRPQDWQGVPTAVRLARMRFEHGFRMEAILPWSQLRITPVPGMEVEFRCNLNKVLPAMGRRQLVWRAADGSEFQRLVLGTVATSITPIAAWAMHSGPDNLAACAIAPSAHAGAMLTIERSGQILASSRLNEKEGRAETAIALTGIAAGPVRLALDGVTVGGSVIGDAGEESLRDLELGAFYPRRGPHPSGGTVSLVDRLRPYVPAIVTAGPLPQPVIDDPVFARRGGLDRIEVAWYDAAGNNVTTATTPGRYGAVINMHLAQRELTVYQLAVMLPTQPDELALGRAIVQSYGQFKPGDPQSDQAIADIGHRAAFLTDDPDLAEILAAEMESLHDGQPARPKARAETWWHMVRTKLGTQTVYPYAKRLPNGYDADPSRRWGAVIYLHGKGGVVPSDYGNMENRLKAAPNQDLLGWLKEHPQPFAAYALMSNGGWEEPAVADAVRRILAEDRIDPDQVVLMGFSMGGIGTWDCVTDDPALWAAAVPIGGRGGRSSEMARLGRMPVWIFNGDVDQTTPLAEARSAEAALKAAGGDVRLTVLPGMDHFGSQAAAFATPGLWEWLMQQHRKR